jgi:hypothetical protein
MTAHRIPSALRLLELTRIGLPADQAPGCDICDTPSSWAIRSAYDTSRGAVEFLTNLCAADAGYFLDGLTDRLGARDA